MNDDGAYEEAAGRDAGQEEHASVKRPDSQQPLSRKSSLTETDISEEDALSFGGEDRELMRSLDENDDTMYEGLVGPHALVRLPSEKLVTVKQEDSFYGHALSEEQAAKIMPAGDGGLVWNALVVPNVFIRNGKLVKGLPERDFDIEKQTIKPLRPSLPITANDLFRSLTKVDGQDEHPRWIFHGILNGWTALTCLELVSLQARRQEGFFVTPKDVMMGQMKWVHYWSANREGKEGIDPTIADENRIYRARFRGAPWTAIGWSKESPGFVFWHERLNDYGPRLNYGTNIVSTMSDHEICTMVHMVSHRYAVAKETPKDRLTYHSIVLLEWNHGNYCTVVEGAYLNGVGGYKGKSNWYDDKDEPITDLYRALPNEMVAPWLSCSAEIRCYDVKAKNIDEFKAYVEKYKGRDSRFVDPRYTFSHRARLSYRSKKNIAQYCLNYTGRDCSYDELKRNCQTFAADFCAFLAGKKTVEPFHPVNRIQYENRTYLFLYESSMYERTRQAGRKIRIYR